MGRKGREIVQTELNVKEVIDDLNKAVASKWAGIILLLDRLNGVGGFKSLNTLASRFRANLVIPADSLRG